VEKIGLRAFVSYSHKDEALRAALGAHLSILVSEKVINPWHDRAIEAGEEWDREIEARLNSAEIVLLLVSSDFLASRYCYGKEMERALERHEEDKARVIPVILRPCDWQYAAFAKLQALPRDGKPVTTWTNQDEAFVDIARGIRRTTALLRTPRASEYVKDVLSEGKTAECVSGRKIDIAVVNEEKVPLTIEILDSGLRYQCNVPLDARVDSIIVRLRQELGIAHLVLGTRELDWDLYSKFLGRRLDARKTLRENQVLAGDTLRFSRWVTAG